MFAPRYVLATLGATSLLVGQTAAARASTLYAESVQSCANSTILTIRNFDLQYFPVNETLRFNIQGRSLRNDVRPTINAQAVAYGMDVADFSFDVCSVLEGGLCPLPTYNFSAQGEYPLPANVAPDLPGIAYTIPNLEAAVRVTLIDNQSGATASCLDVTLSNGWTTGFPGVAWAAGGIAIAAFVASIIHSFFPLSPNRAGPEWRFFTLISFYQWIAVCGMLSLEYPGLYQVFTLNFAWSVGLIKIAPIARSIDAMRLRDGGRDVTGDSFDPASLSYSFGVPKTIISNAVFSLRPVATDPVQTAARGIAQYAEQVGVSYPNTFTTALVVFLLFCAVVVALILLGLAILFVVLRTAGRKRTPQWSTSLRHDFAYACITNILRVLLVGVFPLILFAFYTFRTVPTSGWACTLLAALTLAVIIFGLLAITFYVRRVAKAYRDHDVETRFEVMEREHQYSKRWASLYAEFKPAFWWAFMPTLAICAARAAFVAFAQGHPWVQTIGLAVIEVLTFIALCVFRPFRRRGVNALEILLSVVRIFSIGFLMVFIDTLRVNRFIVTGLGAGLLAIQSLIVLLFFILTVFNLFAGILWARKGRRVDKDGQSLPWNEKHPTMAERRTGEDDDELTPPGRPYSNSTGDVTLTDSTQPAPWTTGDKPEDHQKQHPAYVYAMPGAGTEQSSYQSPVANEWTSQQPSHPDGAGHHEGAQFSNFHQPAHDSQAYPTYDPATTVPSHR